jgi:protein-L-isoaspartate(D-aspartate) O-methyltransferase
MRTERFGLRGRAAAGVLWLLCLPACVKAQDEPRAVSMDRRQPGAAQPGAAPAGSAADQPFREQRQRLVDQLRDRGIRDSEVLRVMAKVPRHEFVPQAQRDDAYLDTPLPIGQGQTISQPFVVAHMTEALKLSREHKVLEIGTGSGYQAAILAELSGQVYTIEILPELAERARRTLTELGYKNVHVRAGDGYKGWPEQAPFDRVIVTAAPDEVPQTLLDQLAVGGRMVVPVGSGVQDLVEITKTPSGVTQKKTLPVRFVPMVKGSQ